MIARTLTIGWIVFGCVFGGALLGMLLRRAIPTHHLSPDSRDVVKLGVGLIGTMAALALGLLLASAKASYDAQGDELRQLSATAILLDRALAHYGPEANQARDLHRQAVAHALHRIWAEDRARLAPAAAPPGSADFYMAIVNLTPRTPAQRLFQENALKIGLELGRLRFLLFEEADRSMPTAFLVMLVFWLTVIFVVFGLLTPPNGTVVVTLFVCALSVSGAVYLILELARPFQGLLRISDAPLRDALQNLGL